ncbi:hypothetical protein [Streptomyces sp. NPDC048603]|uniref:hypothetical protein n=1 Tax=Streptomyces sp. NPDC048603 TaxID=3365577 RepID=UPI003711FCCB
MRARRSRTVPLLFTSVVLTGLLIPGALAQPPAADPARGAGGGRAAPGAVEQPLQADAATVNVAELPVEPPAQPARPPAGELFGADCRTTITGSSVTAYCHNPYPETDLVRLHVECDRWWDLDGDSAGVAVEPAAWLELTGRCWKEVRSAWVSHRRG